MKRIAENSKRNIVFFYQLQQPPEIRVQNGVAARNIKVGQTVIHLAKVQAVIKGVLYLFPRHSVQLFAGVF